MKHLLSLVLFLHAVTIGFQQGYPVPPTAVGRLFYIQHSNNHNTYVYDANIANKKLNTADPVKVYRIDYTKGGVKGELTTMQRKMAYGVAIKKSDSKSCEFTLAAYDEKTLYLKLDKNNTPYVQAEVNGKTLVLAKLYLKLKGAASVEYIEFTGKDVATGKTVAEKLYIKG
jgi:Domain of unknown function (DUF4833)